MVENMNGIRNNARDGAKCNKMIYLIEYTVKNTNGIGTTKKIKQFVGKSEKCIPKRIRECPTFKIIEVSE